MIFSIFMFILDKNENIKQTRKVDYLLAYLPLPRIPINSTSNTKVAPAGIRSPAPRLP